MPETKSSKISSKLTSNMNGSSNKFWSVSDTGSGYMDGAGNACVGPIEVGPCSIRSGNVDVTEELLVDGMSAGDCP